MDQAQLFHCLLKLGSLFELLLFLDEHSLLHCGYFPQILDLSIDLFLLALLRVLKYLQLLRVEQVLIPIALIIALLLLYELFHCLPCFSIHLLKAIRNLFETYDLVFYEILLEGTLDLDGVHHILDMDHLLLEVLRQLLHRLFELLLGCLDLLLVHMAKDVAELRDDNVFVDSAEELVHVQ